MLTVIEFSHKTKNRKYYWKCKCSCGNKIIVRADSLKNGHTKSCGHYQREVVSKLSTKDLMGKIFGRLIVIGKDHTDKRSGRVYWLCKCDCGNFKAIMSQSLINGSTHSCSCYQKEVASKLGRLSVKDLIGRTFGFLTVLYQVESIDDHARWHCICNNCGNEVDVSSTSLIRGNTKSCGCLLHTSSMPELEIKDYLQCLFPNTVVEKSRVLDGKEIDIYLPEYNLGIEYNGSVYHATEGAAFKNKDKYYHRDKFLLAKSKGIHLISVFDVDWLDNKEIIKKYIHDLVAPQTCILADDCDVSLIDIEIADSFEKSNMLLYNYSKCCDKALGIFYNNELIATIKFNSNRLDTTNITNVHSYTIKHGYDIIDGISKLISVYEANNVVDCLLVLLNNDYYSDNIYTKAGFNNIGVIAVPYYWTHKDTLIGESDIDSYNSQVYKVYRSGITCLVKYCHSFGGNKQLTKMLEEMS